MKPEEIAHKIVQTHMNQAGVIGYWELLEERIAVAIRNARVWYTTSEARQAEREAEQQRYGQNL
jgi:hypothetical protein